ncbi:hypothetical protein FJ872_17880 [Mesorhizobium sp. B2-5-9]|uniref:hypothetical protein n=1 Tax=Mesorhizobium sp. B2-5-9 TaxID=2589921 RepID=UPI00112767AF|nr:hypothetical protein [Mesorhizobium sp. B2-5-9]TPK16672.1 hypothetical protein FJ872_17880 [Mesorhizobium sp. B2-5-9]
MAIPVVIVASGGLPVTVAANGLGSPMEVASNGFGMPVTFADNGMPVVGITNDPFSLFTYDIDFVAATVKGGTQPYGSNTNDGRLFRDPNNVNVSYVPNAAGLLVQQASAGLRRTDRGHWQYPGATIRNLWNRDLTNAAWVKTNMTAAKDQTGADGAANVASSLLATAANATCLQTITLASSTVLLQVDIKRLIGTGNVDFTVDGGTTWTTVAITASYALKFIVQAAVTNPVLGFRLATSGDKIAVDFASIINPANSVNLPSQYRAATTTATVLNAQSRPSADIADSGPLIGVARGAFAFYWQGRSERATGAFIITGATGLFCSVLATGAGGAVKFSDGPGVSQTADSVWKTGLGNVNKVAGYVTAGGLIKVAANGVLGNLDTDATLESALDHFDLGTNGAGANSIYGLNERFAMAAGVTFTDAQLIAMTT